MSRSIVRVIFREISVLASAFTFTFDPGHRHKRRTWCQIVLEAHANLAFGVGGDSKTGLSLDVFFREVDVPLGCRVDDVDVNALTGAGTDVGGDDDEGVCMGCVPYAFFGRNSSWREGEFNGGRKGQEKEEEEEHGWT